MNNIFELIKKKFYNSFIGSMYLTYIINRDFKKFNKELNNKPIPSIVINNTQEQYRMGLKKMKQHINKTLANKTKEGYDKLLKHFGEDILNLSKNEDDTRKVETLKKVYVFNGSDIKNTKDKKVMIDKRITDFKELRRSNELRKKAREERRNRNNGN